MTDKELIRALRICPKCQLYEYGDCGVDMKEHAANRLEELLAENERLKAGKDMNVPTTEVMVARRGRWVKHEKRGWICTSCGSGVPYGYTGHRYCHVCGARMDGGDNHA